jgi:hypothetical protein
MFSRIFPQMPTMRTGTPLHSPLIVGTVGSVSEKALETITSTHFIDGLVVKREFYER